MRYPDIEETGDDCRNTGDMLHYAPSPRLSGMHASAAGCIQSTTAPSQAVPDAKRHHMKVLKMQ